MVLDSLNLYLEACRCVLTAHTSVLDDEWHNNFISTLTNLRHSLCCRVCGFLLKIPTGMLSTQCGHFFCQKCVGLKPKYIINTCAWCRDIKQFNINTKLSLIVRCFVSLCKFILDLSKRLQLQLASINFLFDEALKYDENSWETGIPIELPVDDVKSLEVPRIKKFTKKYKGKKHKKRSVMPNLIKLDKIAIENLAEKNNVNDVVNASLIDEDIGPPNLIKEIKYDSIHLAEHDYNLPPFNEIHLPMKDEPISEPSSPILIQPIEISHSKFQTLTPEHSMNSPNVTKDLRESITPTQECMPTGLRSGTCFKDKIQGCRCAMVSRRPGNLTCCGQRCPCYSQYKGCGNFCKCQGCRNTRGASTLEPLTPFFNFHLVNNAKNCLNVM